MAKSDGDHRERRPAPTRESEAPPSLSRERVAQAAVGLLDERGLKGLTMRRLSERCGSGVMSLYWHVKNKDEVLDLALDFALEDRAPTRTLAPAGGREEIARLLGDWRAAMLRHPWSASLLPRRALGPSVLARLERLGETLSGAGVADDDLNTAIWALWNYVIGATVTRVSFERSRGGEAEAQQQTGDYPMIERTGLLREDDWEGVFRGGLRSLLDGIVAER